MLRITIPATEEWDPVNERFYEVGETTLELEHSLISLSKWESRHHKAFLDPKEKLTPEERLDYIRCMTLTKNVNDAVYFCIPESEKQKVRDYIDDPMSGQKFYDDPNDKKRPQTKIWTAERFYYAISSYQLDWRVEKWHLNRLFSLIKFCSNENEAAMDNKKMTPGQLMKRNSTLNAARKKAWHTKG